MNMKLALVAACAMGAAALPAAAKTAPPNSQYIFYNDAAGTGTFGATVGSDPTGFSDTFTFETADPTDDASVSVTYNNVSGGSKLDITSVTFDGHSGTKESDPFGGFQYAFSNVPITAGFQDVVVNGTSTGSFSGTIDVATTSAAPEPSAWLLMIVGVAGSGLMLRRARKQGGLSLRSAAA